MAIETKQLLNLSQIYRDRIAKESVLQEKKAAKDYDGDGKVESGKDEYFGAKDKAIKKAMGKKEVKEADTYAAQLARFEAGRQKRMKASGTYERPKWIPKDQDHSDDYGSSKGKKVKKESFSDWRHDLKEIPDYEQIPASAKKRNEKIEEKDVKNTIKINPEMKEELEIIEAYVDELSEADIADILGRLERKRISKGGNPDESPLGKKVGREMKSQQDKGRKKAGLKTEDVEIEEGVYEKQKTKEVMGALKKRDLKKDVKAKIAADIVKKKGDTSKADDRYAYESKLWDEVAENLTQLGELNDADFRVEGYQRNPERDTRSARQRRMDDPDTGINSQAFRDFMAAQQRPAKKKPVAKKKDSK